MIVDISEDITDACYTEMSPEGTIQNADGTIFKNFLSRPEIQQPLARYVHAHAREVLWHGFVERCGKLDADGDRDSPQWLRRATDGDLHEDRAAYLCLELALQEEVEKRVAVALAEAKAQTKKTTAPKLRELTRHLVTAVRRGAAEQQASNFADTESAMEAAGLKKRASAEKEGGAAARWTISYKETR